MAEAYTDRDRERWLEEPAKRVPAPVRTSFERDRARVVHSASLRRLAAKTQVVGPESSDFGRNRLTHSLEVAQIARDLAHPLGAHPDLAETAALAHDLGHPPFGHNGEDALDQLAADFGGFEGNAQTFRILTRLEAKSHDGSRSIGLNLTRATLDACTKYPWSRREAAPSGGRVKFGVYDDDREIFDWMRAGVVGARRSVEAQIMDIADDIAYSVHDLEDGIVAGSISPRALSDLDERAAVWETTRRWYLGAESDAALESAFEQLGRLVRWPLNVYGGSRAELAALKNLTSDLIGIFCGAVHDATVAAHGDRPLVRHRGDVEVPHETMLQIGVLKGIAAHYVMSTADRLEVQRRQRELLAELFDAFERDPKLLAPQFLADYEAASGAGSAKRVLIDQLASLTDASAVDWARRA